MTTISFPGLGIEEFTLDAIAIPIGDSGIRWYALFIVLGMIFAVIYCSWRAKGEGIVFDTMLDFAIFTIPMGVIGTRLFYVFFDWVDIMVNHKPNPYESFIDVIAIWNGGLAIYGGIIFGTITIFVVAKVKKMSKNTLLKITDAAAPGVMIAQSLGRWGNFFNGEAYGTPTALPWRMCSDKFAQKLYSQGLINRETAYEMLDGTLGVHPTFLYESLWNILGFILINIAYKKKRFDGQIMFMYFAWYGFGRMFIELLRTDSLTNGSNIRISSLIGLLSFIVAGSLLLYLFIRNKGNKTYGNAVTLVSASTAECAEDGIQSTQNDSDADEIANEAEITDSEPSENTENSDTNIETTENSEENNDGTID